MISVASGDSEFGGECVVEDLADYLAHDMRRIRGVWTVWDRVAVGPWRVSLYGGGTGFEEMIDQRWQLIQVALLRLVDKAQLRCDQRLWKYLEGDVFEDDEYSLGFWQDWLAGATQG